MTTSRLAVLRSWTLALSFLLVGLLASSVHARSFDVTVEYTGKGKVDANHKLYVLLYNTKNIAMAAPIGFQWTDKNGGKISFSDVQAPRVYLLAMYDRRGGYSASGPAPYDSPIGIYKDADDKPIAVYTGEGNPVRVVFDDSMHLSELSPQSSAPRKKLEAASGVVEIRMYKIKPGYRDKFVSFFEKRTLGPQKDCGMRVVGQFRSLEDDDTFVWIRAFENERERQEKTATFYGGPIWTSKLAPEAMNMIASTQVILVEPTAISGIR